MQHHNHTILLTIPSLLTRFTLEQRILELESGRLEHHVRAEDHAALRDERDALAARLREAADTEARGRAALEAEKATVRGM
jgi:hypothetical protein